MANRVTDVEVKTIFETDKDIIPFITTANLIVTEVLGTSGMSEDRLKQIELFLSAHFACVLDPRIAVEKIGDATNTYEGKTGAGLDSSRYGVQVKLLDSTGLLMNLDKKRATIEIIRADITRTSVLRRGGYYW